MNKGKYFWDRRGNFVNKETGQAIEKSVVEFSPHEWYQTLYETIQDVNKDLLNNEGLAIVVSPDVSAIIQCMVIFKTRLEVPAPSQHTVYLGTIPRFWVFVSDKVERNIVRVTTIYNDDFAEVEIKGIGLI